MAQGPSPARALPPIGSPSPALTPALVAPAPANTGPATTQPQVESFDEETYRVRPGDNFQAISHSHYQTESYAQALVEFNRNHPLTSEADRQNLPLLRVGQSVYIPPTSILEKRYANVLKERSPAPGAGGTATTRDSSASPVPAPAPSRSALSTYHVKAGGGELMFSIAAQKLGDGKRWTEIKELNPSVDFTAPVPAGTTLKLPADARID